MKRIFALLLAAMMLLTLTACGGGTKDPVKPGNNTSQSEPAKSETPAPQDTPKTNADLETYEMVNDYAYEEVTTKVTFSYPKSFTFEEDSWGRVEMTDEAKNVYIAPDLNNDGYYDDNQEMAKEENVFYEEATFGDYQGFAWIRDDEDLSLHVVIYLDYLDIENVWSDVCMEFDIRALSSDYDADTLIELYRLPEVQQVLNSVVYTAPVVSAG